jgi:hypothetical protein
VRYMVIEAYTCVDSWIEEPGLSRCFQLMETDDPSLFDEWIDNWNDLADFEIVPVVSSGRDCGPRGVPSLAPARSRSRGTTVRVP